MKMISGRTRFPGMNILLGICTLSAHRSKDPSTQVGACIVSPDHKILSMGYNGFPKGCSDDIFPWAKMKAEQDPYNAKYFYVTPCGIERDFELSGRFPGGRYDLCHPLPLQ